MDCAAQLRFRAARERGHASHVHLRRHVIDSYLFDYATLLAALPRKFFLTWPRSSPSVTRGPETDISWSVIEPGPLGWEASSLAKSYSNNVLIAIRNIYIWACDSIYFCSTAKFDTRQVFRIRIRMDSHWFAVLNPDPMELFTLLTLSSFLEMILYVRTYRITDHGTKC